MKYSVIVSRIVDDYVWHVYENATEQVIDTFFFLEDATDMANFMEHGGAFDGLTPSFMLKPLPVDDLNAKFEQFIA